MGNDGGVIAVKRRFMRNCHRKGKTQKLDPEALRKKQVTTCALTEEPLKEPIVACELGNLYNKEALIERLIDKSLPSALAHISSLKDVVTCHFSKEEKNGEMRFFCPITMDELNGNHPFVVMRPCGCVVSARALKEIEASECLACNQPLGAKKPIPLFPPQEQVEAKRKELLEAKQTSKKRKKHSKHKEKDEKKRKTSAPATSAFAREVEEAVSESKKKSAVYASMFEKKKDKTNANDLLMTIGGIRYTLS